jgi:hypothetical protein
MNQDESLVYNIMSNIDKYAPGSDLIELKDTENGASVYSLKLVLKNQPFILTYKLGQGTVEVMLSDRNTGDIIEYISNNGDSIHTLKRHNYSAAQVKEMLGMN